MGKLKILTRTTYFLSFIFVAACATKASQTTDKPETESLSPHQKCLLKEQNEKKAIYESLPGLLKQVSGDSQIIAEHGSYRGSLPLKPTKKDLDQAILAVPENPEDGGPWGTPKEGHAGTASGYVVRRSELSNPKSKNNISLFHFSIGQPGRPYAMPITSFRAEGDGLIAEVNETFRVTPLTGLPSDRTPYLKKVKAQMKLQPIDKKHVLVLVDDRSPKDQGLNFTAKHAFLVRTYPHRDFDTADLWQDWPVYDDGEFQSSCEGVE